MRALRAIAISIILGSIGADAVKQSSHSWYNSVIPPVKADIDKSLQEVDTGHVGGLMAEAKQHFQAADSATKAMASQGGTPTTVHSLLENDIVFTTHAPERLALTTLAGKEVTSQGRVAEPPRKVASLMRRQESQTTGNTTSAGAVAHLTRRQRGDQNSVSVPTSLLHETVATDTEVAVESAKTSRTTNEKVLVVSGLDVNGRRSAFNGIYYPGPDSTADVTCKQTWIKPCKETDLEACLHEDYYATYKIVYQESSDLTLRQWLMELHSLGGNLEADGRAYTSADDSDCSPEKVHDSCFANNPLDKDDLPMVAIYTTTTTSITTTTTTTTTTLAPATQAPGQAGKITTSSQAISTSNTDFDSKTDAPPGLSRWWLRLFLPFSAWLAIEGLRLSA